MRHIYHFGIDRMPNMNGQVLTLLRYTVRDDKAGTEEFCSKQEVFTVDGWHEYSGWDALPVERFPHLSGLDLLHHTSTVRILDEFEEHIRGLLEHHGVAFP